MGTKGKQILAAVLLAVSFLMPFTAGASSERYRFNSKSVRIIKDMIGLMKKENLHQTAERRENLANDLEKIRKLSDTDYSVASAIMDCWENVMVNEDYRFIIYEGGTYATELEDSGIGSYERHAFVVMGYALSYGKMQKELEGRCDAAAAAARSYPDSILICTGGATGGGNPDRHTEAGEMKAYLTERCGIDPARIFTDTEAKLTVDNAMNTLEIMKEQDIHACTIVTSDYHQRWSQMLFRAMAAISFEEGYPVEIVSNYNYRGKEKHSIESMRSMALSQLNTLISRFGTAD